MKRPWRRVVATCVLVMGTVAPTAFMIWTALEMRGPAHLRAAEKALTRRIGLNVRVESVRYPRPGEVLYRGVYFAQGEPRGPAYATVARADELHVGHVDREVRVQTVGLRLRGDGPRQAVEQIAGLLGHAGDGSWDRLSLLAPTCHVELGNAGPVFELTDLVATYHEDRGAPTVSASFRGKRGEAESRCELVLTRDRQGPSVRHRLKVATREGDPLSARALDPFFDAAAWLGPKARLWGTLALERLEGAEWSAEFQGRLIDVDLEALVGRRFADHRLNGLAQMEFRSARWGDRGALGFGWVDAEGSITAGPGSISRGLLDAMGRQLRFRSPASIGTLGPDVPFQALGLTFSMTAEGGLVLGGALDRDRPTDAVIVDSQRVIASAPRETGDVRALVNALFSGSVESPELMVPGDRDAASVQRYLPAPASLAAQPAGVVR